MSNKISVSNTNIASKPVAFCGLKENLRLGEKVLKEIKTELPFLKSHSILLQKQYKYKDKEKYHDILVKLSLLNMQNSMQIKEMRSFIENFYPKMECKAEIKRYVSVLKEYLKEHPYANCGECADLSTAKVMEEGKSAIIMNLQIRKKFLWFFSLPKKDGDHAITAFGLKKGAQVENPKTYGNKAVVLDASRSIVMPFKDAIEYYKTIFDFNPKTDFFTFRRGYYTPEENRIYY